MLITCLRALCLAGTLLKTMQYIVGLCTPAWEHELCVQPHREAFLRSSGAVLVVAASGPYLPVSWPLIPT